MITEIDCGPKKLYMFTTYKNFNGMIDVVDLINWRSSYLLSFNLGRLNNHNDGRSINIKLKFNKSTADMRVIDI